ncbi:hypothetical protein [Paenibacillus harenae]|uniref:Uncharacterized protein n=1 Tax=Paenibacillus harenae TaxID=306543 RepID=A0ABT9U349_PAEHA|nr:hypothetical protein [Paenibacillus harenae]MDQ0058613.1 hypothetical protein [Paenibacillus harenae]MDQ0114062.1 hypothetical protein [Paenibacillus harenae]
MAKATAKVTPDEMKQLKMLAEIVKNPQLPMSDRRIAKSQYETIIKHAKGPKRGIISSFSV